MSRWKGRRFGPTGWPLGDHYLAMVAGASPYTLARCIEFKSGADKLVRELLDESMTDLVADVCQRIGQPFSEEATELLRTHGEGRLFCGLLPSEHVNASSNHLGNGYLVLVNDPLLVLLAAIAAICAAALAFQAEDGTILPPLISTDAARLELRAALDGGAPISVTRDLDEQRADFADGLLDETLTFVIAHEIAHIVLGHLARSRRSTEYLEFAQLAPKWGYRRFLGFDEVHADVLACKMADRLTVRRGSRMNYFGATVFLQLSGIIDGRAKRRRYDLHPHPTWRTSLAISGASPDGWDTAAPYCDAVLQLLDDVAHGPRPPRDRSTLGVLMENAAAVDWNQLNRAMGYLVSGIRVTDTRDLRALIDDRGERGAAASLSALALKYLEMVGGGSRCVSGRVQLYLYMVYGAYFARYGKHPEAAVLDGLLRGAIPELDTILELGHHVYDIKPAPRTLLDGADRSGDHQHGNSTDDGEH